VWLWGVGGDTKKKKKTPPTSISPFFGGEAAVLHTKILTDY
jgi:hypothetical protein